MLKLTFLLFGYLFGMEAVFSQTHERSNLAYKNGIYDVFTIKTDTSVVNNFTIVENKMHLNEADFFSSVGSANHPFFAITASITDSACHTIGLYINNGIKIKDLNNDKGSGNFYLMPNGFFAIDSTGPKIAQSSNYNSGSAYHIAVQSGPMLVIDGVINSSFSKLSKNLFVRCAVGTFSDNNDQYLVFVKSVTPVSFYQIAELFLDKFKCNNALNLESGSNCSLNFPNTPLQTNAVTVCNYIMLSQ